MKNLFTILFLFLIAFSFSALSQSSSSDSLKIDSLKKVLQTQKEDTNKVNTLNSLCETFLGANDNKNAARYGNEALLLSGKLHFKRGKADAYFNVGKANRLQRNYPDALKNLFPALKMFEEIKDEEKISKTYWNIARAYVGEPRLINNLIGKEDTTVAIIYLRIGGVHLWQDNDSALYYTNRGLELANKIGFTEGILDGNINAAIIYGLRRDDVKAIEILNETIELSEKYNGGYYLQDVLKNIGLFYTQIGEGRKALDYFFRITTPESDYWKKDEKNLAILMAQNYYSLNMFDSSYYFIFMSLANLQQQGYDASIYHTILGNIHRKRGNYDSAFVELTKANWLAVIDGIEIDIIKAENGLAETFYAVRNFDSSLYYANQAMRSGNFSNFPDQQLETFTLLKNLYTAKNNFDSAFKYTRLTLNLKDSLYNRDKTRAVQRMEIEQEIKNREAVRQKEAYESRMKIYALVAAMAIFSIIAFILWRNNLHKKKANFLLQQQKEKVESTLSELKSAQAQLIQTEKMASLGELTAGIAHEIQNPLNFVNNFSEVNRELIDEMQQEMDEGNLVDAKAISNDIKENEEKINHHGKRADAIVKGMLQHSRSSSNIKEPTDINALADEYLRLAYHGLRAKDKSFNATITTDFDKSIGKINIIPQDMSRVLLNLYNNAFYAVTERRKQAGNVYEPDVSVSTKMINDKVEIKVKDNGNGIPEKVIDKIFQPFFTTKPTGQGTGLGLSLSYDIIKAHGGEIKVETREDDGAEFVIQLPITV